MKIQILSDLHIECGKTNIDIDKFVDVIVLAGDIHNNPNGIRKFLIRLREQISPYTDIVYVLGNHEYYGHKFPDTFEEYKTACKDVKNVHLLEKDIVSIGGVKFIGTTLYTDLSDPINALAAQNGITDFRVVEGMTPEVWTNTYKDSLEWLSNTLIELTEETKVVVTHSTPSPIFTPTKFINSPLEPAFTINLSDLILDTKPDLWIYGHNHESNDLYIGATRIISNQLGYPTEECGFKKTIVEIANGNNN